MPYAKALLDAELYSGRLIYLRIRGRVRIEGLHFAVERIQFDFYNPEIARAWSHKFANLIDVSGLKEEFEAARLNDSVLEVHWNNVEDWSEMAAISEACKRTLRISIQPCPIPYMEFSHVYMILVNSDIEDGRRVRSQRGTIDESHSILVSFRGGRSWTGRRLQT